MIEKKTILEQSTAVRTTVLPEVRKILSDVVVDYDSVGHYKTSIVSWLKPIIDLSNYSVYPTCGITEGLNWWFDKEPRSVTMSVGEYQWITPKNGTHEKVFYQSWPSSIDGNFCNIKEDIPVVLDLAYVGSTKIKKIEIGSNVEKVFFSLSKSFGVRNIRTGWMFTKTPDARLESLVYNAKYYNYHALNISEKIINTFDIDYIHKRLAKQQQDICNKLDLIPSDSVWLATTQSQEYNKFIRSNNTARLCLSGVYNYES